MKKHSSIAVIGAGVSGMSIARMLDGHQVTVYERAHKPGGLIKCEDVDGNLFHTTGGHVFNTRSAEVLDWFWSLFDRDKEFIKADRNASIILGDGTAVGYPIENHVYQLPDSVLTPFIADLQRMTESRIEPANFEEFLLGRFGETLYRLYFEPYNRKVWGRDLSGVPLTWLEGKLPMPTVGEMIYNNIRQVKEKKFVHSTFYYPRRGGSQFIADRLARGLDIRYGCDVEAIIRHSDRWVVEGREYDAVVYTGNIKELPGMLHGVDTARRHADAIEALEWHGTTSVLCEIDPNPYSWIYLPDSAYRAHRIICTGNFSEANNRGPRLSATVEFTDSISLDDILDNLRRMPFAPRYITHHYAPYTYPIQDHGTRVLIQGLGQALAADGLHLLGRFAEWEYYNMDVAIGAALKLAEKLTAL